MSNMNFYERLNASATASFDELKRNYKQLILQCHPDKLQQQQLENHQQSDVTVNSNECDPNRESDNNFNAINEAWNTLKDPIKRKLYDAELLQTKFETHINIYATITLNDMQRTQVVEEAEEEEECDENETDTDKETSTSLSFAYAYNCRCGGQYVVDESAEQREQLKASEMIVECSECSLVIIAFLPTLFERETV